MKTYLLLALSLTTVIIANVYTFQGDLLLSLVGGFLTGYYLGELIIKRK